MRDTYSMVFSCLDLSVRVLHLVKNAGELALKFLSICLSFAKRFRHAFFAKICFWFGGVFIKYYSSPYRENPKNTSGGLGLGSLGRS
jgi:hypothetical protein